MTNKLSGIHKDAFDKAVVRYAIKNDLDPLVIEKAYEGREMMLVVRDDQRDSMEAGMAASGSVAVMAGVITTMSIAMESGSYGENGPLNNIEIGGPFVLAAALVTGFFLSKRKKVIEGVKGDVERFTGNPQMLLPAPKPENPKLI